MVSILIILKKKMPKGFICPYTGTIFYNIRIYSRSQVSVYRTIGPLVCFRKITFCLCVYKVMEVPQVQNRSFNPFYLNIILFIGTG